MGMTQWPLVAVDPGEEHVGIALFDMELPDEWWVQTALTLAPDAAIDRLWDMMLQRQIRHLVVEEWRVHPGNSGAAWSTCKTAEVIGALRYRARSLDTPFDTIPPRVKKPMGGWVRRTNTPLIGDTVHARDAELIGWACINGVRA